MCKARVDKTMTKLNVRLEQGIFFVSLREGNQFAAKTIIFEQLK